MEAIKDIGGTVIGWMALTAIYALLLLALHALIASVFPFATPTVVMLALIAGVGAMLARADISNRTEASQRYDFLISEVRRLDAALASLPNEYEIAESVAAINAD